MTQLARRQRRGIGSISNSISSSAQQHRARNSMTSVAWRKMYGSWHSSMAAAARVGPGNQATLVVLCA